MQNNISLRCLIFVWLGHLYAAAFHLQLQAFPKLLDAGLGDKHHIMCFLECQTDQGKHDLDWSVSTSTAVIFTYWLCKGLKSCSLSRGSQ